MSRLALVGLLALAVVSGCTSPPGRRGAITGDLDPATQREAATAYRALLSDPAYEDPLALREAGLIWLDRYAGARNEDHVLLLTGRAAARTGDLDLAVRLLERLGRLYPESGHLAESRWSQAVVAKDRGRWLDEAEALVRFYEAVESEDPRRAEARERLRILLEETLATDQIEELWERHPRSVVGSTAAWIVAQRRYEEGETPERVVERLERFVREYPRSRYVEDARALIAEIGQDFGIDAAGDLDVGLADRIGLLAPLSGPNAVLGQAMFDGAMLAVEEHNRATGENVQLVALDTRSDEVVAVKAVRRLIENDNVIAVVGALLSSTTVPVATLCQERGVPLISPTATKETITELGEFVFQTTLTDDVETAMLARAGVEALRRTRYGILHPQGADGELLADRFAADVERLGGRVVVRRLFDPTATDFRGVMREIRAFAPEALFVPAGTRVMRLIAPQLVFHDVRAQLMGMSSWDNQLLTREVGPSMHRAIFPSSAALISESDEAHFDTLWSRRHRATARNPNGIDLKTYYAVRRVIAGLDRESGNTRTRLRDRVETGLMAGSVDEADGARGLERLRMIEGSEVAAFPVELFPAGAPAPAPSDTLRAPFGDEFESR